MISEHYFYPWFFFVHFNCECALGVLKCATNINIHIWKCMNWYAWSAYEWRQITLATNTRNCTATTPATPVAVEVAVRVTNNDRLAAASTIKVNEGKNPWKIRPYSFFILLFEMISLSHSKIRKSLFKAIKFQKLKIFPKKKWAQNRQNRLHEPHFEWQ